MSFIESALLRDEKIVHFTRPHWIIFVPGFLILVVAICLMHYGPTALPGSDEFRFFGLNMWEVLGASMGLLAAYWLMSAVIRYFFSEYAVTNKRVIMKVGMIQRDTSEIFLSKLEAIDVDQSILGRLLSYGTLAIIGTGGTREVYSDVPFPFRFRRVAQQQVDSKYRRQTRYVDDD